MVNALNLIIIQTNINGIKKFHHNYVLNLKINQLKMLINGNISLKV
jgi:hypothetical protein